MQLKLIRQASLTSFFFRCTFICAAVISGTLAISAFSPVPESTASSEKATSLVPDTLSLIDYELKERLLAEIQKNRHADSLTTFALGLKGIPYRWGGKSLKGFDCSGFVFYIFGKFGHSMERSSRAQSKQGRELAREDLQKGDLLFFTGSNPQQRRVGHVGIVISEYGEEVEFIHSSSKGGVKVSKLQGYYTSRFIVAKRLLNAK